MDVFVTVSPDFDEILESSSINSRRQCHGLKFVLTESVNGLFLVEEKFFLIHAMFTPVRVWLSIYIFFVPCCGKG